MAIQLQIFRHGYITSYPKVDFDWQQNTWGHITLSNHFTVETYELYENGNLANAIVTGGHLKGDKNTDQRSKESFDIQLSMNMQNLQRYSYFYPNGLPYPVYVRSGWITKK